MEVVFWLRFRLMQLIVSYFGRPMTGSMVEFRKSPTTSALARLIGAFWGFGDVDRSGP